MTADRRIILVLIKVMVTFALVYWLYAQMQTGTTLEVITGVEPGYLLLAVCLHCMVFILSALRWWLLLSTTNVSLPFSRALPSYYLGVFLNNFLPTSMGGDVARIVHLRLRGLNTKALIGSSLVDRIIGLTVVIMIGACGVLASPMIPFDTVKATALVLVGFASCKPLHRKIPWHTLTPRHSGNHQSVPIIQARKIRTACRLQHHCTYAMHCCFYILSAWKRDWRRYTAAHVLHDYSLGLCCNQSPYLDRWAGRA
jgi:Lysylphosphatidylglycerol synthase TM region